MRALLDINVIIALLDPDDTFHNRAHAWWAQNQSEGWASCPITENGVVRIMSNPAYSERVRLTPADLVTRLRSHRKRITNSGRMTFRCGTLPYSLRNI